MGVGDLADAGGVDAGGVQGGLEEGGEVGVEEAGGAEHFDMDVGGVYWNWS